MWHGADPPRTEQALAAAVPMRKVPAWRVYLGMPGHGRRSPKGGVEEIMRLAAQGRPNSSIPSSHRRGRR